MAIKHLTIGLLFFATSSWAQQSPRKALSQDFARGRILIETRSGIGDSRLDRIFSRVHGKARKLGRGNLKILDLPNTVSEADAIAALANDPDVKFVELDRKVETTMNPNDPYFQYMWHPNKIGLPMAWNTTLGEGVTIAILDSGIDSTHPDLAANLVPGYNVYDNNTNLTDVCGHGTAVAGAAGAVANNSLGVAGAAGKAKIMPIRVAFFDTSTNSCFAYYSTIASGITYAADHGARIVNVSYATLPSSAAIQSAGQYLKSKGGLLFVSAGNTGADEGFAPTNSMIVVSGTNDADARASWSSFGNYVSLAAPGDNILTTSRGGGYQGWTGTSFASPIAAGVAALMMSARPNVEASVIESLLYSSAVDLGAVGRDRDFGYGRVDAAKAMVAVLNYNSPGDSQAPAVSITSPANTATVSGSVTVNVSATDNVGVSKVDLFVNDQLHSSDSASPYSFTWNTASLPNGAVKLVAVAYDAAGNSASSSIVNVNVANLDNQAPTVSITSPSANATVKGIVSINASASDNVGVSKVEFRIKGALVFTDNSAPYDYQWDTKVTGNGSAALTATAYDAAGNSKVSTTITVTVSNDITAPTVSITAPSANATVKGVVAVTAKASDSGGVDKVDFKINGVVVGTDTTSPYSYSWDSKSLGNGAASISAIATDKSGNVKESTVINVTIANDQTPPAVSITSPTYNTKVKGIVAVTASASDNVGVTKVEFKVGGTVVATDTSSPYSFNWDSKTVSDGVVNLTAVATDAAGNSTTSNIVSVVVDNALDTQSPTASILSPYANSTVSGVVSVNVSASDNSAVAKVELRVNGTLIATDTASPYAFDWNSKTVANGQATLIATSYDLSGNKTASNPVTVTVFNDTMAPTVSITSPTASSKVSGTVMINATASDNVNVTKVEFKIKGVVVATDIVAPYSYEWDTKTSANGSTALVAVAYDAAGNSKASSSITVTVSNDVTAPTVSISSPTSNATVKGLVTVKASASDAVGVTKVEFYLNGNLMATDTASPYSFDWDSKTVPNGTVSFSAKAYDAAGNVKTSTAVSAKVANPVPDTQAPAVSITNPNHGSKVTGKITVSVKATDDSPVTDMTLSLMINGATVASGKGGTLSYKWNTKTILAGEYSLEAIATDASGNSSKHSVQVQK